MADEQKTVFISYRRSASAGYARAVFMDLRANGYDVFMDVESINSGYFDRIILNQIEARAHFVLLLSPGSVERCANPDDWLRREIEYAMDKQRNLVPLFVSGFTFAGTEPYLTGKLAELSRFNGLNVPLDYFDEAMTRLRTRFLKQPVYGVIKPAPASDQSAVQHIIAEIAARLAPTEDDLSAEDYFNRALQMYEAGDPTGAIANYNKALHLKPSDAEVYNSRGKAYLQMKEFKKALQDFQKVVKLDPNDNRGYGGSALAYYLLGEKDKAHSGWNILLLQDLRYRDADWVGKTLNWSSSLLEAARPMIAEF